MLKIVFKNLEKSELAKEAAEERLATVADRFPDLCESRITVTLSMENSPLQAGPDVFSVKIQCHDGRYRGVIMQKSASSLYIALADLVDHLLEKLNRQGDKARVTQIHKARHDQERLQLKEVPIDEDTETA